MKRHNVDIPHLADADQMCGGVDVYLAPEADAVIAKLREQKDAAEVALTVQTQKFLEFERAVMRLTEALDEHPEWYGWACSCGACRSVADPAEIDPEGAAEIYGTGLPNPAAGGREP